jgi:hypothetical protein
VGNYDRNVRLRFREQAQASARHHSPCSLRSQANGGGAGICTRVRKYIPAGLYDAYPLLESRSRRQETAKNRRKPAPENLIADVRNNASATSLLI